MIRKVLMWIWGWAVMHGHKERARRISRIKYEDLYNLACRLALALAYESLWLEYLPTDHTMKALANARTMLSLERELDQIDSLREPDQFDE